MSAARILIVDDAPEYVAMIAHALEADGYAVATAPSGEDALTVAREQRPDLVVLDLGLPGIDGIETCRRLRAFSDAYVLMLTGRGDETDRVAGLTVGADDYVVKPFYPRELRVRVQALLRRPRLVAVPDPPADADAERPSAATDVPASPSVRRFGALTIDVGRREVSVAGRPVELSRTEFDLLDVLSDHPDQALSRSQLMDAVWGADWFGDDHVIDVHLSNLRRKLGEPRRGQEGPRYIVNVRGFGYRMERRLAS
ncbi:response regulator transcription factor [Paraconexibacter algicola]|uniref:DNA-binding response regulator n=1 Tax=Paraconexibacter algicola TaxID=2133960 RepID=A0A2T4UL53_9ACTN|nr:response regulator transcription factor [Paraconexibacter algicola]PTL59967.1 DNA-binding response regulator [Paraconexibacter algicola]